jgi:hypothetical protein
MVETKKAREVLKRGYSAQTTIRWKHEITLKLIIQSKKTK